MGGFLGAGKTTLIWKMALWLRDKGLEVALVTNDQGEGLLNTASAKEALSEVTILPRIMICDFFPGGEARG